MSKLSIEIKLIVRFTLGVCFLIDGYVDQILILKAFGMAFIVLAIEAGMLLWLSSREKE